MESEKLVRELRALRQGEGVGTPHLRARLGPCLLRACRVEDADDEATVRSKVKETLMAACAALPEDDRKATVAALALAPGANQRFLKDRIGPYADEIARDVRTAMRRVDGAQELLAEVLMAGMQGEARRSEYAMDGWYYELCSAVVILDDEGVTMHETRRIVATADDLQSVRIAWSSPVVEGEPDGDLEVVALYGGEARQDLVNSGPGNYLGVLRLPHSLKAGDRHEFCTRFRQARHSENRYTVTAFRRTDRLAVRIKFPTDRLPRHVWRVDGLPGGVAAGVRLPPSEPLYPDAVGEVMTSFDRLHVGLSYGIRWE